VALPATLPAAEEDHPGGEENHIKFVRSCKKAREWIEAVVLEPCLIRKNGSDDTSAYQARQSVGNLVTSPEEKPVEQGGEAEAVAGPCKHQAELQCGQRRT